MRGFGVFTGASLKSKKSRRRKRLKLLLESESVLKALRLATAAHSGQVDKAGADYIKHSIAVAEALDTEEEQTAALLHDTIEDTEVTLDRLKAEGFSSVVVVAVERLTHRNGESRETYLQRVVENPLAVKVKLADLAHNSDLSRLSVPTEKDYARAERYAKETAFLKAHI